LMVFPGILFPQEKISLSQAIKQGLRLSGEYQNRLLEDRSLELEKILTGKDKFFSLGFESDYLYKSQTMSLETPSVSIPGLATVPGKTIEAGVKNNFDLKLSLVQPLYSGGILSNNENLVELRRAVEKHNTFLNQLEIAGYIKSSFFTYLELQQKKSSLEIQLSKLSLHYQKLDDLYQEGLVKKSDLLETLSRQEEIKLSWHDIAQAIEQERIHFIQLTGHSPDSIDETYRESCEDYESSWEYFESNHPVLKALDGQVEILALQKKIFIGKYRPHLNGFAELHYGKPGLDFFEKKWSLYFQGGLVLNIPVFSWNKISEEKSIADFKIQKVNNQRQDFARDMRENLEKLFAAQDTLSSKLENLDRLIAYSQEDASLKNQLFMEKQITNLDYLTTLLSKDRYVSMREEVLFQLEQIKVNINTLVGRVVGE
ncbi:MAG: TolC family protein, partial [Candidatus Aminicenantes bacterium]|nr:TolC family protein [Candidatus Aminicenantes bacterium]